MIQLQVQTLQVAPREVFDPHGRFLMFQIRAQQSPLNVMLMIFKIQSKLVIKYDFIYIDLFLKQKAK